MSNHYYADGAIHEDHHKELTINGNISSDELLKIAQGFMGVGEEEVKSEECQRCDDELPEMVRTAFAQPALTVKYLRVMMERYYGGSVKNLALIYCVLSDYSLLRTVGCYKDFVRAVMGLGLLELQDEKGLTTLSQQVSAYMRDRKDKGELRKGLRPDFRHWDECDERSQCEAIASVFGEEDDWTNPNGCLHYKYKRK